MVVATGAFEGEAEEGGAEGGDAVVDVVDAVFLLDGSALGLLRVKTVKRGSEDLLVGGIGQQIAGELVSDEFVPREIFVERLDDPVAPRPHVAFAVDLETVAVGVAREVEPIGGHAFAVAGRGEQAVDQIFDYGFPVLDRGGGEGLDFSDRWRQAGEIEGEAADESSGIGLGLERELPAGESGGDETVDRVSRGMRGEC